MTNIEPASPMGEPDELTLEHFTRRAADVAKGVLIQGEGTPIARLERQNMGMAPLGEQMLHHLSNGDPETAAQIMKQDLRNRE